MPVHRGAEGTAPDPAENRWFTPRLRLASSRRAPRRWRRAEEGPAGRPWAPRRDTGRVRARRSCPAPGARARARAPGGAPAPTRRPPGRCGCARPSTTATRTEFVAMSARSGSRPTTAQKRRHSDSEPTGDDQLGIAAAERAVRGDRRVPVARAARLDPGREPPGPVEGMDADHRTQQAGVDSATGTGALALRQRSPRGSGPRREHRRGSSARPPPAQSGRSRAGRRRARSCRNQ